MARVLVIDDDPLVRGYIRMTLTSAGHAVDEAEDGRAGLTALRERPFDLVVCDLFMPGQEGIETILDIRRQLPQVPVVAVSGGGRFKLLNCLETAAALGAVIALPKPFTAEALRGAVADLLTGRRPEATTCTDPARREASGGQLCPSLDTCPHAGSTVECGAVARVPLGRPAPVAATGP